MGQAGGMGERERALAKLTLSLRITGVRHDGYHLLDAEMVTIDLADVLTFTPGDGVEVVGAPGLGAGESNLVRRALRAVDRVSHVLLEKRVPVGAGLGGGSADAAAVLRWAGCSDVTVAVGLGADVPFCVVGGRARLTGVGENVQALPFQTRSFTLLTDPEPLSTAEVYAAWDELGGPTADGANDLEPAALSVRPQLRHWRDRLGAATGQTPVLAGSGGTWFVEGEFPEVSGAIVVRTDRP